MTMDLVSLGALMVEVMRPEVDMPLNKPFPFYGPFPSGAAAITTSTAARLGFKCAFAGIVGNDPFGTVIYERLKSDGIDLNMIHVDEQVRTGVAFVSYKSDGSRTFSHHIDRNSKGIKQEQITNVSTEEFKWLHLSGSSITSEEWKAPCHFLANHVLSSGGKVSFDPNLRIPLEELKYHRDTYMWYISHSELFLPNEQEILALFPSNSVEDSIRAALDTGCKVVVVKRDKDGCLVSTSQKNTALIPGFDVNCIDPTGAGDSFNGAFVVAYERGMAIEEAARFANLVAGISTTKLGPMEGSPTLVDIYKFLIERDQIEVWNEINRLIGG